MKVSIVVPVYNAEKYLHQCVNSILSQNFPDFELLIIDDGSVDQSGQIAHEFAKRDQRVRVFSQGNSGVSAARNRGIENAEGTWITFIDADDTVQTNYLKILETKLNTDWIHLPIDREVHSEFGEGVDFDNKSYMKNDFVHAYSLYPHFPESCAKFFKSSIIKQNNLRFDTRLKFGEDALFNLKYLKYCQIITTGNLSKYIYNNGVGGLSKLNYDITNDTVLFLEMENELNNNLYPSEFKRQTIPIPLMRYLAVLYYSHCISPRERRKLVKKYVEKYYNIVLTIYTDPKIRFFILLAHYTGLYHILDFIMAKSYERQIQSPQKFVDSKQKNQG